ncbi:MAG: DUF2314 domain-containing protein [Planctomycetota bacterium]|nr:DUF2314 domain-containing protein [Planctomycetota bacterium]
MSDDHNKSYLPMLALVVAGFLVFQVLFRSQPHKPLSVPKPPEPPTETAVVLKETPKGTGAELFPAGSLYADHHRIMFAVYFLKEPKDDPVAAYKKAVAAQAPGMRQMERADLTKKDDAATFSYPFTFAELLDDQIFPPPDEQTLKYFGVGLTPEQTAALPKCKHALVMHFVSDHPHALQTLAQAAAVAMAVAEPYEGILWDEETRQALSLDAWKDRRLIDLAHPETVMLQKHVTIHSYRNDTTCRMITLGMQKFGLPDVVIQSIGERGTDSGASLINLTCQTLWEQGKLDRPGVLNVNVQALKNTKLRDSIQQSFREHAKGSGTVHATQGTPEDGDPENRLMEIAGVPKPGQDHLVGLEALISEVFGFTESLVHADRDDPELIAARDKARARIAALAPKMQKGLPHQESFLVKAPFRTDSNGIEWMWVEVTKWEKDELTGILANEPFEVHGLKAGATVKVKQGTLFDYIYYHADGTTEGNETSAILEKQQKAREGKK